MFGLLLGTSWLHLKKQNAKAHIPMHRRIVRATDISKILHQLLNPEGIVAANWSFHGRPDDI